MDWLWKRRKIIIDGEEVGISKLENILKEVEEMSIKDEEKIKEELIRKTKVYSYVPFDIEKWIYRGII